MMRLCQLEELFVDVALFIVAMIALSTRPSMFACSNKADTRRQTPEQYETRVATAPRANEHIIRGFGRHPKCAHEAKLLRRVVFGMDVRSLDRQVHGSRI